MKCLEKLVDLSVHVGRLLSEKVPSLHSRLVKVLPQLLQGGLEKFFDVIPDFLEVGTHLDDSLPQCLKFRKACVSQR